MRLTTRNSMVFVIGNVSYWNRFLGRLSQNEPVQHGAMEKSLLVPSNSITVIDVLLLWYKSHYFRPWYATVLFQWPMCRLLLPYDLMPLISSLPECFRSVKDPWCCWSNSLESTTVLPVSALQLIEASTFEDWYCFGLLLVRLIFSHSSGLLLRKRLWE